MKYGVIGNAYRFKLNKELSPGPGDYKTEFYKSISGNDLSLSRLANLNHTSITPVKGTLNYFNKSTRE